MVKQTKTQVQVQAVLEAASKNGFEISFSDHVFTVSKPMPPTDTESLASYETAAREVLSQVPLRGGSIWGTNDSSAGECVAMQEGLFEMNKSGTARRFMAELQKALDLPF